MRSPYNPDVPQKPTWSDWKQLRFWLKAVHHDGIIYLEANRKFSAEMKALFADKNFDTRQERAKSLDDTNEYSDLCKYHFVLSLGKLMRMLKAAQKLFPEIQPIYSKSRHMITEAKDVRDMIEHEDDYLNQSKSAKKPDEFVRIDAPIIGMTTDATGVVVNENGTWIGGRLNVEQILTEVNAIYEVAKTLPPPVTE